MIALPQKKNKQTIFLKQKQTNKLTKINRYRKNNRAQVFWTLSLPSSLHYQTDAKVAADSDGDVDANPSPTKDKDGDNGSQGRQTAVLVESDGFVTKNGHRVVIQHTRSPSTTSRSADVWEMFASPLNEARQKWNEKTLRNTKI